MCYTSSNLVRGGRCTLCTKQSRTLVLNSHIGTAVNSLVKFWKLVFFHRTPLTLAQKSVQGPTAIFFGVLVQSAETNGYKMRADLMANHILISENPTHTAGCTCSYLVPSTGQHQWSCLLLCTSVQRSSLKDRWNLVPVWNHLVSVERLNWNDMIPCHTLTTHHAHLPHDCSPLKHIWIIFLVHPSHLLHYFPPWIICSGDWNNLPFNWICPFYNWKIHLFHWILIYYT